MTKFFQGKNTNWLPAQSTTVSSVLTSQLPSQWTAVPLTSHFILRLGVICTRRESLRTRLCDCRVEVESLQFAISVSARVCRQLFFLLLFVLPVSGLRGKKRQRDENKVAACLQMKRDPSTMECVPRGSTGLRRGRWCRASSEGRYNFTAAKCFSHSRFMMSCEEC